MKRMLSICLICVSVAAFGVQVHKAKLLTAPLQASMTPNQALTRLIQGNERFVSGAKHDIDFIKKAKTTASGQHPAAIILSCIDARVPPEIIFDQNIGNIFVSRVAANVINSDVLGGMEFATKLAGAKLIVVMGHDNCGAIKGACENVKLGHLTSLLNKIQPAMDEATDQVGKRECANLTYINTVAEDNVRMVVKEIPKESNVIASLVKAGKVKIVGAMYHLDTGKVTFLNK